MIGSIEHLLADVAPKRLLITMDVFVPGVQVPSVGGILATAAIVPSFRLLLTHLDIICATPMIIIRQIVVIDS